MKIALVTLQGNQFGQTPEAGPDRQDQRLASLVLVANQRTRAALPRGIRGRVVEL